MSPQTLIVSRPRLAVLALLFSVGVATAVAVAAGGPSDNRPAQPAAQEPNGTGTVVGARPTAQPTPGGGRPTAQPTPGGGPSGVFSISGDVAGLVPGATKTLALTVTNPNPWPIQVLTLDTSVSAPDGSACATTISVGRYTYSSGDALVTAPARGSVRVDVPVAYVDSLDVDQTGCAGTTFPLAFTGTAVRTNP